MSRIEKGFSIKFVRMGDVEVSDKPTKPFQKWNKKKKQEAEPKICSKLVSIVCVLILF